MICSRRLYKGNSYEICLPLADSGVTLARFYTAGDVIIEKEPEISGDSMCFSFTEEEIASLPDGVLRYELVTEYETTDTNSPYVIVTPADYSGSTLEDMLEDAYDSGYTAGQEDCSGETKDIDFKYPTNGYPLPSGGGETYAVLLSTGCTIDPNRLRKSEWGDIPCYVGIHSSGDTFYATIGTSQANPVAITRTGYVSCTFYDTDGNSYPGKTFFFGQLPGSSDTRYDSGYTDGYESGYTDASEACNQDLIANLNGDYYVIPEGTYRVRDAAFANTSMSSITIPSSVLEIKGSAFAGSGLISIDVPDTVTDFSDGRIFADCRNLQNAKLPNGVSALSSTFVNCLSLTGVTLPSGLTTLGQSVFEYCQSLSSITLPDSLTSIGYRCFLAAKALEEITIPSGVTTMGNMMFYGCESLRSVYFLSSTPPSIEYSTLTAGCTIYVPCDAVNAYKTAWRDIRPGIENQIQPNPDCGE